MGKVRGSYGLIDLYLPLGNDEIIAPRFHWDLENIVEVLVFSEIGSTLSASATAIGNSAKIYHRERKPWPGQTCVLSLVIELS